MLTSAITLILVGGAMLPNVSPSTINASTSVWDIASQELYDTGSISTSTTKSAIEYVFGKNAPLAERIALCESGDQQFNLDGSIKGNENSSAIGVFQIIYSLHNEEALSLGDDITNFQGNIEYAKYLFDTQGVKVWDASFGCWSRPDSSG